MQFRSLTVFFSKGCNEMKLTHRIFTLGSFALLMGSSLFSITTAQAQSVAILGAPGVSSWNIDVQSSLVGTGFFSAVDVYDISTATPSLSTLQAYSSVLVFTDADALDSSQLGDELDAYLRGGGGVVDAVFATASVPVNGSFLANNDYSIIPASQDEGNPLSLVPVDPSSPLLSGVNSFNGGSSSFYGTGTLNPLATLVANWSNGSPLVAFQVVGSGIEVSLNFYPPSDVARSDFWDSRTDGARLLGNALLFSGQTTLASTPEPGSLALLCGLGVSSLFTINQLKRKKSKRN